MLSSSFFLLFIMIVSLAMVVLLNRRGYFEKVQWTHYVFTAIGVIFPFIDIIQTHFALSLNIEGNPALIVFIYSLPEGVGWGIFVISHILFTIVTAFLGWQGKNVKKKCNVFSYLHLLSYLRV
jgi:hypothetical protein